MWARKHKAQGFTLVEILIVVVILGILAAIVIPQFSNASETAKASSLISQLQTIRSQLELYQVQHGGNYPVLGTGDWSQLTDLTNEGGFTSYSSGDATFGPYLQKAPENPFVAVDDDRIKVASGSSALGTPSATVGWVYNPSNGEIKASLDDAKALAVSLIESDETSTGNGDIAVY